MKPSLKETALQIANDLYSAGVIDSITMREYEALALPQTRELSPRDIKHIRLKEKVSQEVFAKYLNTTVSTVRQWEQGVKHPRGTSLKLLNLVADKGLAILV
jgi:putative transcriptional regulator